MVGTIVPIGHGERQHSRVASTPSLHAIGALLGAAALGGLLGTLGSLLPWQAQPGVGTAVTLLASGSVSLLYGLHELGLAPAPAPQCTRQVPVSWWGRLPTRIVAFLYGLILGGGLATRVTVATFYAVVVWAFLSGDPFHAALIMGAFGCGRALPILWLGMRKGQFEEADRQVRALLPWQPVMHLVNGLALGLLGAALVLAGLAAGV